MSDVGKWSVVASENNKPSPDGWAENMAPSDVNNSARENMAAIKRMVIGLPYVSTGGVITYVNETTFTVADDELDQNYAKYFVEGRKINVITATTEYKGSILTSEYASGLTTVTVGLDEAEIPFPVDVLDVKVGLQYEDINNATGPNMLGMVLPYTADVESIPFGFGLANGEPFNPTIYKDLAELYYTGVDGDGLPTYKYGTTVVDGNYWPNKPDVRGYFPRFLDTHASNDEDKIDPDSPRTVGSVQEEATSADDLKFLHSTNIGSTRGSPTSYPAGFVYAASAERVLWRDDSNMENSAVITSDAVETRPANVAFPGLLVMFGGYASASQVHPEDLVDAAMDQLNPQFEHLEEELRSTVNDLAIQVDEATAEQTQRVTTAIEDMESRVDDIVAQIESDVAGSVAQASAAAADATIAANRAEQATAGKQEKATRHAFIIQPSDWSADKTYVASISGLKPYDLVFAGPGPTEDDTMVWTSCGVYAKAQGNGTLTMACKTIPNIDLTVNVGVFPYDY